MKRIFCLITALCLIFGSFSFAFANDWSSTDQANLQNVANRLVYQGYGAARLLYDINSTLSSLSSTVSTIASRLTYGNTSIASLVDSILDYMSPIYNALTSIPVDNATIIGALGYYTGSGSSMVYHPYLNDINSILTQTTYTLFPLTTGQNIGGYYNIAFGTTSTTTNAVTAIINRLYYLEWAMAHWNNTYTVVSDQTLNRYGNTQSLVSFANPDSTVTFTPSSAIDGLYKYLNALNTPLARLGYVLASDSRIEAQEAAAANEQAVVDNFIDSNGAGSASTSDISSVSDLSSGYQQNFGTDASVSGIFNIFNSNNMGWFSSETFNQLDTTQNTRKGNSIDTPLLNKQIEDIYNAIGLENHD